jgi:hypothetical protein
MTALELIKRGWTQGVAARNKRGNRVCFDSPRAIKWCAIGAIENAHGDTHAKFTEATSKLLAVIQTQNITGWNDDPERTHAEVIAAFEKAGI